MSIFKFGEDESTMYLFFFFFYYYNSHAIDKLRKELMRKLAFRLAIAHSYC